MRILSVSILILVLMVSTAHAAKTTIEFSGPKRQTDAVKMMVKKECFKCDLSLRIEEDRGWFSANVVCFIEGKKKDVESFERWWGLFVMFMFGDGDDEE